MTIISRSIVLFTLIALGAALPAADTLDEVLAKYYKATGGLEKITAMTSFIGRGKTFMAQMGMDVPMVIYQKRPNKICLQIQVQDKTIQMAYDGKTPWQLIPFMSEEAQAMTGDQAVQFIEGAEFDDPLVTYKKAGHKVELVGREDFEGTPVLKIKLVKNTGREIFFFLDQESGLLLKTATIVKTGDVEVLHESTHSDYKEVNGLMIAFAMENKQNGQTNMKITMDSFEINAEIDDALFVMPVKKVDPAGEKK